MRSLITAAAQENTGVFSGENPMVIEKQTFKMETDEADVRFRQARMKCMRVLSVGCSAETLPETSGVSNRDRNQISILGISGPRQHRRRLRGTTNKCK
jgi:hypothetical protein